MLSPPLPRHPRIRRRLSLDRRAHDVAAMRAAARPARARSRLDAERHRLRPGRRQHLTLLPCSTDRRHSRRAALPRRRRPLRMTGVLQALDRYYGRLAARSDVVPPGYSVEPIGLVLILGKDGTLIDFMVRLDPSGKR